MAKLDKSTLALTFKFDCDRFLRFRLASDDEREIIGVVDETYKRPGIELIRAAGRRWEADKYQDLIDLSRDGRVVFLLGEEVDPILGREPFKKISNLFDLLRQQEPPLAIIEAEFVVPENTTPGLQKAYEDFGLDEVRVRPDIIWIRPSDTGAPKADGEAIPEFEIHIIDVKMAAEPSLRHFTEVTYYAMALEAAIRREKLSDRYAVSMESAIWPGNHDRNAFRNLVRRYEAKKIPDPVSKALSETLIRIPHEAYKIHVRKFFEDRLLRVLAVEMEEAKWHVGPKCQLCEYLSYCKENASKCDHLSRLPWLNQGQADLLRQVGLTTTKLLLESATGPDNRWQSVIKSSHQLRANGPALATRARSLAQGVPLLIEGRRSAMIPAWTDQSIFITLHFDPGSGISFSLGASRVYWQLGRNKGDPPITDEKIFIVDRVDAMNPETERERLKEFVTAVSRWLTEISDVNRNLQARERLSSHFFVWDMLQVRQLKRMFERHMRHPDVIELIELLTRFFPPDSMLPDPETYKSQPGTVVKEVIRLLVGLPIPHNYSLFDVANKFFPTILDDGRSYEVKLPFGFTTPMSDQIPFERAYELWQDNISLAHLARPNLSGSFKQQRYTRDELYNGIKNATKVHLQALQTVVYRLRKHCRNQLVMKKTGFSAASPSRARIPEAARSLIAYEKLDVVCREIENRKMRLLPVDEREARFFSIRGLTQKPQLEADQIIKDVKLEYPQLRSETLYVFNFSSNSRDSKISEGDFTVVLSNENEYTDFDKLWRLHLNLTFFAAEDLLEQNNLGERWMVNRTIGDLLQVKVIQLDAVQEIPYVVLKPRHQGLFQFAIDQQIVNLNSLLVLDPIHRDFSSARIEKALKTVGGRTK